MERWLIHTTKQVTLNKETDVSETDTDQNDQLN